LSKNYTIQIGDLVKRIPERAYGYPTIDLRDQSPDLSVQEIPLPKTLGLCIGSHNEYDYFFYYILWPTTSLWASEFCVTLFE